LECIANANLGSGPSRVVRQRPQVTNNGTHVDYTSDWIKNKRGYKVCQGKKSKVSHLS
jgi:hypothetical protein